MRSFQWIRTMPALAILIAAMAAYTGGGCGDDGNDSPDPSSDGGSGGVGEGGTGGGGSGGSGGTGGEGPVPCETDDDCPDGRCDEIEKVCVPPCIRDRDCGLNTGLRCDTENGGICVPGEPCDKASNCGFAREFDYCKDRDVDCYCQEDQTMQDEEDAFGVCWRTADICGECESAEECGGRDFVCEAYNYGGETRNVCLKKASAGACGAGTIRGEGEYQGLCVPQFDDCKDFQPCLSNDDCDQLRPICDLSTQTCTTGCSFNYVSNRSQGCPPQQVCHATAAGTDPNLIGDCAAGFMWGQGECASPCEEDAQCQSYGEGFVCEAYGTEKRCVPAAAARKADPEDPTSERIGCLSDDECAIEGDDPELGYCDLATFTCVEDGCRWSDDWRNGCNEPFEDCDSLHKCVQDPESGNPDKGQCVEKDCIDLGGADAGCFLGEFCANEPYVDPFTGEQIDKYVDVPSAVAHGQCYSMNESAWCQPCEGDEDCAESDDLTASAYPSRCVNLGEVGRFCAPGCDYNQECPGRWACQAHLLTLCGGGTNAFRTCETNDDCGGGSTCVEPTVRGATWNEPSGLMTAFQGMKFCACDPSQANACGDPNYECNAGLGTMPEGGEIQASYCTLKESCGLNGSCEFFGLTQEETPGNPNSLQPVFQCSNDGGAVPGLTVECPEDSLPGGNRADRFICVDSQVCFPTLNQDGVCGLNPPPED